MEINFEENKFIILNFDKKIDYKIYKEFNKIQSIENLKFNIVYLDFSDTKFITLPGVIYIIYFLNYLKRLSIIFESRIINIDYSISAVLAKYGFLKCTKFYGNLVLDQNLEKVNIKYLDNFSLSNIQKQSSLYWPIRTIPEKSGSHFESDESGFTNSFVDYFNMLEKQGKLGAFVSNLEEIKKGFIKAAYELGKNIWEHSHSWGLFSIQSTDKTKTNLAICDNGIGFIGSYILRNPDYVSNPKNNKDLIEWLLIDGHSSKGQNTNGHGLTRVMNFIRETNGTLLIRSDKFEITLKGKQSNPEIREKEYFNGTQVFINF